MMGIDQIIDIPLPPARNYTLLRETGIDILLQLSGTNWTNYNNTDPGVTALDQLCFALTELGYCQSFEIKDIVTKADGALDTKDQFFLPQDILTTSPITINDYRRLLIDQIDEVENAYIDADVLTSGEGNHATQTITGGLKVRLYARRFGALLQGDAATQCGQLADTLLDQFRNLGQWFHKVTILQANTLELQGRLTLEDGVSQHDILPLLEGALDAWISPPMTQYGYDDLIAQGLTADQILCGPYMQHGWIKDDDLAAPKIDRVSTRMVETLLGAVPGVESVSLSSLTPTIDQTAVTVLSDQIAVFDLSALQFITTPGASLSSVQDQDLTRDIQIIQQKNEAVKVGARVAKTPTLPKGTYRDIARYQSIQTTFPEAYGIGENAFSGKGDSYRQAQARQFKGYLMVFDQLLANQFSQLGQLSDLFRFSLQPTKALAPHKPYDGIPTQISPPTYFSQPLYQVPDVKPLLLGNDMYAFSTGMIDTAEEWKKVWERYKDDPFNQYRTGLRDALESETECDTRRNQILDHLLARHDLSGKWLDNIIFETRWYGSTLKTRIIVKSLLLQAYPQLSYFAPKSYSQTQALPIATVGRCHLTAAGFRYLDMFDINPKQLTPLLDQPAASRKAVIDNVRATLVTSPPAKNWSEERWANFNKMCLVIADSHDQLAKQKLDLWSDGQLQFDILASQMRLGPQAFENFAAIEILLDLLMGLQQIYQIMAGYLISLTTCEAFKVWLAQDCPGGGFNLADHEPDQALVVTVVDKHHSIALGGGPGATAIMDIANLSYSAPPDTSVPLSVDLDCYTRHIDQLLWLAFERRGALLLEPAILELDSRVKIDASTPAERLLASVYILPDYIRLMQPGSKFHQALEDAIAEFWPSPICNAIEYYSFGKLQTTIDTFISWRNSPSADKAKYAGILLNILYGVDKPEAPKTNTPPESSEETA